MIRTSQQSEAWEETGLVVIFVIFDGPVAADVESKKHAAKFFAGKPQTAFCGGKTDIGGSGNFRQRECLGVEEPEGCTLFFGELEDAGFNDVAQFTVLGDLVRGTVAGGDGSEIIGFPCCGLRRPDEYIGLVSATFIDEQVSGNSKDEGAKQATWDVVPGVAAETGEGNLGEVF